MARKSMKLKSLKAKAPSLQKFICVDSEAVKRQEKSYIDSCGIERQVEIQSLSDGFLIYNNLKYDNRDEFHFTNYNEFWDYVDNVVTNNVTLTIFAHNWNYDFQILAGSRVIRERGWEVENYINDSNSPFMMTIRLSGSERRVRLIDTTNYFPASLKELGENLGLPKLDMPEDNASQEEWDVYVKRDTEIVEEFVKTLIKLLTDNEWGILEPTISKQAFTIFRTQFYPKCGIYLHGDEDILGMERESYLGGRAEAHKVGYFNHETVFEVDYKSMYPSIMRNIKVPTKLVTRLNNPSQQQIRELMDKGYCVVVRGTIKPKAPRYGMFSEEQQSLIFPMCEISRSFSTPEVEYIIENNEFVEIDKVAVYQGEYIFTDFVDTLFNYRKEYDNNEQVGLGTMVKTILNALYGKFGQKVPEWARVSKSREKNILDAFGANWFTSTTLPTVNENSEDIDEYRVRFGRVEMKQGDKDHQNSFTAIASHITAQARVNLYKGIEVAGEENVYYMDTDSLHVNREGKRRLYEYGWYVGGGKLPDEDYPEGRKPKLGELGLDKIADAVQYDAPKTYRMWKDGVNLQDKSKGIKSSASFEGVVDGKELFSYNQFGKIDRCIKAGYEDAVIIETQVKARSSAEDYTKRHILPDGSTVSLE